LDQLKEENLADVQLTQVRLKTDYQTGFCVHFVNPLSIEYYDISLLSDHRFLIRIHYMDFPYCLLLLLSISVFLLFSFSVFTHF